MQLSIGIMKEFKDSGSLKGSHLKIKIRSLLSHPYIVPNT